MLTRTAANTINVLGHYLRTIASTLPIVCFVGALVTDVTYWRTSNIQWANFSAWFLAVGMLLAGFAFIIELVHRFRSGARKWSSWFGVGVMVIALAVALADNFVHARDGWTSVVPVGLILTAIAVALMIAAFALVAAVDRVSVGDVT